MGDGQLKTFIHMFYSKFFNDKKWNIGFTEDTVELFLERQKLGKVQWMKHDFRDRLFADPFVLKTTDNKIIILAEELVFSEDKGRIVRLVVDKKTKQLLDKKTILDLKTHLSYPAIIQIDDLLYIYPENNKSGKLNMYSYNDETYTATFVKTLLKEPLADSTILNYGKKYWLIAVKIPQAIENAYLYSSNSFDGDYSMVGNAPIASDKCCSRPAGNFIINKDKIYRPAQICTDRYGGGIAIQKIEFLNNNSYSEKTIFKIYPTSFKYNLGLHTINFYDNGCVIDGYGYLYPYIARVLYFLSNIKRAFLKPILI